MPRLLGIDIPANKRMDVSLRYIYGIGPALARKVLTDAKVDMAKKAKDLTNEELSHLAAVLQEKYLVEGDLRREVQQNIRRLIAVNCYRGTRHRKGLPVHGQRTKTNARTRKGPRRTVGVMRGEARQAAKVVPKDGG